MTIQRVLVVHGGSLLTQGIERLLQEQGGLEVVGIDLDRYEAMESACSLRPDAVIVDSNDLHPQTAGLLLRDHPEAKIICLMHNDGQVQVVRAQQVAVNNLQELLKVLAGSERRG